MIHLLERRTRRIAALVVGLPLLACFGCGNGLPANGTQGNSINLEVGKQQGQAVGDYRKANPKAYESEDASRRH